MRQDQLNLTVPIRFSLALTGMALWLALIKFGRKRKLSDYQRAEAIKRRAAGETLATIAKSYGVHLAMISRL